MCEKSNVELSIQRKTSAVLWLTAKRIATRFPIKLRMYIVIRFIHTLPGMKIIFT